MGTGWQGNWQIQRTRTILCPINCWQTSNLRKHLGLEKQKHSKGDAIPATHGVDGVTLAASQFRDYLPFENSEGRGHCWQGEVIITDASFTVIRRPLLQRSTGLICKPIIGGANSSRR